MEKSRTRTPLFDRLDNIKRAGVTACSIFLLNLLLKTLIWSIRTLNNSPFKKLVPINNIGGPTQRLPPEVLSLILQALASPPRKGICDSYDSEQQVNIASACRAPIPLVRMDQSRQCTSLIGRLDTLKRAGVAECSAFFLTLLLKFINWTIRVLDGSSSKALARCPASRPVQRLPPEVLLLIFQVLAPSTRRGIYDSYDLDNQINLSSASCVSKDWCWAGTVLLYEAPVLFSDRSLVAFSHTICAHCIVGDLVKHITIVHRPGGSEYTDVPFLEACTQMLLAHLAIGIGSVSCPDIQMIVLPTLSYRAIPTSSQSILTDLRERRDIHFPPCALYVTTLVVNPTDGFGP